MMLPFSRHIEADCTVYDCMDELANFRFAPPRLLELERELFERADLVFTGGYSLYEAKRSRHPTSIRFLRRSTVAHFAQARASPAAPDRAADAWASTACSTSASTSTCWRRIADARPDWRFVMVGPVVKIDPAELPQARRTSTISGGKNYDQLPAYLAAWDVALMPFAINDVDQIHLADQDARISRRRQAGGLDPDHAT